GEEMTRLVHFSRLGEFSDQLDFYEQENRLTRLSGKIISVERPEAGWIDLDCGLRAFFTPQRRVVGYSNFYRNKDEKTPVDFYIGFTYEGLRAWRVHAIPR